MEDNLLHYIPDFHPLFQAIISREESIYFEDYKRGSPSVKEFIRENLTERVEREFLKVLKEFKFYLPIKVTCDFRNIGFTCDIALLYRPTFKDLLINSTSEKLRKLKRKA